VPTLLALLGQPESGYPSILLLYFVLMVMLPILILGFKKGLDKWVLATSAALWILAQWRIGPKLGIGYLLGWQLLFVAGAWLGFRRQQSRPFPGVGSRKVVIGVGICFAIFFLLRHPVVRHPILDLGWRITSKEGVGVVRVLDAALFAFLVAVIPLNVAQQLASRLALRPISFFGRHALQVYLWHQILVFSVGLYATRLVQGGLGLQLPVGVLAIASLMLPAWLHASYRDSRPRAALVPSQGRDRLELAKSAVRSEYAD
jgi:hypothetical protein